MQISQLGSPRQVRFMTHRAPGRLSPGIDIPIADDLYTKLQCLAWPQPSNEH